MSEHNVYSKNIPEGDSSSTGSYTPGYRKSKLVVTIFGLIVFFFGMNQLWVPLRVLLTGTPGMAEATRVIKSKEGLPDRILVNDLQIKAAEETQDRSYIFWNEFRFNATNGQQVIIKAPVGSRLKPLYPLLDNDGLPTTVSVRYDPANVTDVIFPGIQSTWFVPGVMMFLGLIGTLIGSFLFYWSNKPIELPHVTTDE